MLAGKKATANKQKTEEIVADSLIFSSQTASQILMAINLIKPL